MAAESSDRSTGDPGGEDLSEGSARRGDDPEDLPSAIESAFDYRGDVTLELRGGESVEGYLFNRDLAATVPFVDFFPSGGGDRLRIPCGEIRAISLSGKDMASGRSWEAWVARCEAKKGAEPDAAPGGPPRPEG